MDRVAGGTDLRRMSIPGTIHIPPAREPSTTVVKKIILGTAQSSLQ